MPTQAANASHTQPTPTVAPSSSAASSLTHLHLHPCAASLPCLPHIPSGAEKWPSLSFAELREEFRVACPALETLELASVNAFRAKVERRYLEFPVHDPLGWLLRSPSYTGGRHSILESVWLGPDDQELQNYRTCETEIESDTTHPFPVFEKPRMYSVPMNLKTPHQEAVYRRSRICWPGIGLVSEKKERFRDVLITARAMAEAILEGEEKTGLLTSSELEWRVRDIVQAWCGGTTAVPLALQQKVVHAG